MKPERTERPTRKDRLANNAREFPEMTRLFGQPPDPDVPYPFVVLILLRCTEMALANERLRERIKQLEARGK